MNKFHSEKLLIATTNPAKLHEIARFLCDLPFQLVSLRDLGITHDYKETGNSFAENAVGKARFYAELSGLPAIADDGGLEIDALGGAPGVYSKRWIGKESATVDEYIEFTLEKMRRAPHAKRGAQLRSVLALALPNQDSPDVVFTVDTNVRGIIPEKPSAYRTEGFPYRSLLFIPKLNKFYNPDEMTPEEEKKYNHRYRGLQKLQKVIRQKVLK